MDFGIASVAAITVICYLVGLIVKSSGLDNKYIPAIVGLCGGVLGVAALYTGLQDFPATDRRCRWYRERSGGNWCQPGHQAVEGITTYF